MQNNWLSKVFYKIPPEYAGDFKLDSLEKNVSRFSILPFFNIMTQLMCIFIYLYMYPAVYPDRVQVDRGQYLIYTFIYCFINLVSVSYFIWLRKKQLVQTRRQAAAFMVYLYILAYVVLEAAQVAIELEISGNVYRFLATFFMVAFFPVIGRLPRLVYMAAYILIAEMALLFLKRQGVAVYSYAEINVIIFIICLIATNVYHNSVIRNFELRKQLEYLSLKDELTGLSNRRSMNQSFESYWKLSSRSNDTIGVIMLDIDHFKKFNDTYGHQAGDDCLVRVAEAIRGCFDRATDITARYGGEEFVIVLPHTTREEILMMAERVRMRIEDLNIEHTQNQPFGRVTCSLGVAYKIPAPEESYELLLKYADDALYVAKESGRNRTVVSDSDGIG